MAVGCFGSRMLTLKLPVSSGGSFTPNNFPPKSKMRYGVR